MEEGAGAKSRTRSSSKRPSLPLGSPCPNCAAPLQGPWCHACGQKADDFHRPLETLVAESVSELASLDGRLLYTLPRLAFHPGALTRDYMDGKRAAQVPPLRLFLVAIVILFLATNVKLRPDSQPFSEVAAITLVAAVDRIEGRKAGQFLPTEAAVDAQAEDAKPAVATMARFSHAVFLFTPLVIGGLAAVLCRRRRPFIVDHLTFGLHTLTAQFVLLSLVWVWEEVDLPGTEFVLLLFPLHLVPHLRGAYGLSWLGAAWRAAVLLSAMLALLFLYFVLLLIVGISVLL